jgi:copper chaperone CopZ
MSVPNETTLVVKRMCPSCIHHVNEALKEVDGVSSVQVKLREGQVLVRHEPNSSIVPVLVDALREAGYESSPLVACPPGTLSGEPSVADASAPPQQGLSLLGGEPHHAYMIVGGGPVAARAAEAVRKAGFEGEVVLVGAERELPYDRPPLSKEYLAGVGEREALFIHPSSFYSEGRSSGSARHRRRSNKSAERLFERCQSLREALRRTATDRRSLPGAEHPLDRGKLRRVRLCSGTSVSTIPRSDVAFSLCSFRGLCVDCRTPPAPARIPRCAPWRTERRDTAAPTLASVRSRADTRPAAPARSAAQVPRAVLVARSGSRRRLLSFARTRSHTAWPQRAGLRHSSRPDPPKPARLPPVRAAPSDTRAKPT